MAISYLLLFSLWVFLAALKVRRRHLSKKRFHFSEEFSQAHNVFTKKDCYQALSNTKQERKGQREPETGFNYMFESA